MWAATMPPAPGTFSTTNGLPNVVVNFSARRRASTSGLPPGPEAAISRTGWVGQGASCAVATDDSASASVRQAIISFMFVASHWRHALDVIPGQAGTRNPEACSEPALDSGFALTRAPE